MNSSEWTRARSPAFRLMVATSWLATKPWKQKQREAICGAVAQGVDWAEFLYLVERHRIPAISLEAMKSLPEIAIPAVPLEQLQRRSNQCRMQAIHNSLLLAGILKTFDRAKIPVMPLKGPLLSIDLYQDPGLRQSHDLDFLCLKQDLPYALDCLQQDGWRLESTYANLPQAQMESIYLNEYHLKLIHPRKEQSLVELHWRSAWDHPSRDSGLWRNAITTNWQGCLCHKMDPVAQLLYLASHGGRHYWYRAKWLGDLARIYATGAINWSLAYNQAKDSRQLVALETALQLLEILHGLPHPDVPQTSIPSFLVVGSLRAMVRAKTPDEERGWRSLREKVQLYRYDLVALPPKSWRLRLASAGYSRLNFHLLKLPHSLYWAYLPLRPLLWAWRQISVPKK